MVAVDPESMTSLPPVRTVLQTRRRHQGGTLPVQLHARLTEIGTIDLWCSDAAADRSWRLQFDVRSATQTDLRAHEALGEQAGFLDEQTWQECQRELNSVFDDAGDAKPQSLVKQLSKVLGSSRSQWPPTLLRRIWEALMEMEPGRRRSAVHEARWLNLLGYSLRPGYGLAVDDWRVAETWRHVHGKLAHRASLNESLILWRRIAGGLSLGQQMTVAERLLSQIRILHQHYQGQKRRQSELLIKPHESVEVLRLLGSLELLPVPVKVDLGDRLVDLLGVRKLESARNALIWTLGRLGQRIPVYGPLNTVVSQQKAASWTEAVFRHPESEAVGHFAVMQMARRSDDRHRDLDPSSRQAAVEWLLHQQARPHLIQLVTDGGQLDSEEQGQAVGEALPKGLRIAD
jgi:hypothetical protein